MPLPRWFPFSRRRPDQVRPGDDPAFPAATPLLSLRYVAIDTELTSLDRRSNRLLSVGAVTMHGSAIRLDNQFYRMVNPGVAVPGPGVLIHQLRPADVEAAGESPAAVLEELCALTRGAVLVGHFISIDLQVLRKELAAQGHTLANPSVDTAEVHRWMLRRGKPSEMLAHQLENVDLETLAQAYKLDFRDAHHALADAFVTAQLWQRMLHRLAGFKIHCLGDLLRIGGK